MSGGDGFDLFSLWENSAQVRWGHWTLTCTLLASIMKVKQIRSTWTRWTNNRAANESQIWLAEQQHDATSGGSSSSIQEDSLTLQHRWQDNALLKVSVSNTAATQTETASVRPVELTYRHTNASTWQYRVPPCQWSVRCEWLIVS